MTYAPAPQAPPYCPNPDCRFHRADRHLWRFVRIGFYARRTEPRLVQRYRCDTCRRRFGDQTFRTSYWLRRADLLAPVLHRLMACSGFRQISREYGVSPQTIGRMSARLGRHALLFHEQTRPKGSLAEPLALDSFESFEWSQYFPTSFHVAVGQKSHFFHGFTDSECRRRGTMTPSQRKRRDELEIRLGRPDPKSIEKEVAALLSIVAPGRQALELHTDEHRSYARAIRRVPHLRVEHRTVSSRAARTPRNPLFPINLLDLLLRHNGAHFKRETIAFAKRRASAAYRIALLCVWRNWLRPFSERRKGPSPAMRLGIADRVLDVMDLLARRLFPTRILLPERWMAYYAMTLSTRPLPNARTHRARYAI